MIRLLCRLLQRFQSGRFKLIAGIPRRHRISIGDAQTDQKVGLRILHDTLEVPAVGELVAGLVVIHIGIPIFLLFAITGRLTNDVGAAFEVDRRYADLGKVELVAAIEITAIGELVRRFRQRLEGSRHTQHQRHTGGVVAGAVVDHVFAFHASSHFHAEVVTPSDTIREAAASVTQPLT